LASDAKRKPIARGQATLEWLHQQRSVNPRCLQTLAFIEEEMAALPEHRRREVERRLSDKRRSQFDGAAFELIAHRALRKGFPASPIEFPQGVGSTPDFAFQLTEGTRYIVDATVFHDPGLAHTETYADGEDFLNAAADRLQCLPVNVRIVNVCVGSSTPSIQRLSGLLAKELDQFVERPNSTDRAFVVDDKPSGWRWELVTMPRRSAAGRFVSMTKVSTSFSQSEQSLHDTISDKRRQHKNLQIPIVVVTGSRHWMGNDDREEMGSLLTAGGDLGVAAIISVMPVHAWGLNDWRVVLWPIAHVGNRLVSEWSLATGSVQDGSGYVIGDGSIFP